MPHENVKRVLKQIIDNPNFLLHILANPDQIPEEFKLSEYERQALAVASQDSIFFPILRRIKDKPDIKVNCISDNCLFLAFTEIKWPPPPPEPPPREQLYLALVLDSPTNSSTVKARLQAITEPSEADRFEKFLDILSDLFSESPETT